MAPNKPSTDARKRLAANLQVLRRYDSQIEAIIDTTSHVVLYQFQESSQSWANKEVEGALFLFKRAAAPYYGFMIMNRLGLDNYTERLSADMSFQTSDQIVIYTSKQNSGIIGIWIYEETDRQRIPEQLSKCCSNANSAALGAGMQYLYPRNSEEENEFQRMYPRSRSNSRKDGAMEQANANALASIINRTRQQQQQQQNTGRQREARDGGTDTAAAADLVSKLQAIGINPTNGEAVQPQNNTAAQTLPADPAIILARKSVNPYDMGGSTCGPGSVGGASEGSAFKSPLPVPSAHAQPASAVSQAMHPGMLLPASPALHPVASPFPPSTIATPLPGQGPPRPAASAMAMQQQHAPWHAYGSAAAAARSAHASPAPMGYGAPAPGMFAFPQMSAAHPGTPQPMAPAEGAGGSPGGQPTVAQNLAEQLVSLVRQRMNSVQGGTQGSTQGAQGGAQAGPAANAVKMQRDYCREWLIRVIQADDELVDAFARRFPPPIFQQPQ
ncbi:hypothetical protein H4S02_001394 [Coemansia sp. RSA 2611]|nr:hypothetical protein H4S02_001394 [Coemansia sp. RSA 2611]